jgi:hypothetical protein
MTNHTDRFLTVARRQRFAMLRELVQAAAMAGLTFATILALV